MCGKSFVNETWALCGLGVANMAFWGSGHWGYVSHGMMPNLPKFTRMGFRRFLGEPREVRGEQVPMLMRLLLIFASYVSGRGCIYIWLESSIKS